MRKVHASNDLCLPLISDAAVVPPSTEPPMTVAGPTRDIRGSLTVLNRNFTADLTNTSSPAYAALKDEFVTPVSAFLLFLSCNFNILYYQKTLDVTNRAKV